LGEKVNDGGLGFHVNGGRERKIENRRYPIEALEFLTAD
jgi:hypothetical protein